MNRENIKELFDKIGARVTIRRGTSPRGVSGLTLNVANDRKGEHFTLTVHPAIDESEINVQMLDYDKQLRQMLLFIRFPNLVQERWSSPPVKNTKEPFMTSRLLVGHDEMHWFVAGVTNSMTVKQAFERLRPDAVTVAMRKNKVKDKNWRKRKNKGFIRQGEWFFVPVHFEEGSQTIIHKTEPISRPTGGKPHYVEEVVRFGGETVYVQGESILSPELFKKVPSKERYLYSQRVMGATVLGRGKVKHPDHHTVELKGWHEIHLSREDGVATNAFID